MKRLLLISVIKTALHSVNYHIALIWLAGYFVASNNEKIRKKTVAKDGKVYGKKLTGDIQMQKCLKRCKTITGRKILEHLSRPRFL